MGIREHIAKRDREARLRQDIILTRQRTGIYDIHTREDMLAVLGRPVSAEDAPMLTTDLTAGQQAQIEEAGPPAHDPTPLSTFEDYQMWRKTVRNVRKHRIDMEIGTLNNYLHDRVIMKTPIRLLEDQHAFALRDELLAEGAKHTPVKESMKTLSQMATYWREKGIRRGPLLFQRIEVIKPPTTDEEDIENYTPLHVHLAIQDLRRTLLPTLPEKKRAALLDKLDLEAMCFLSGPRISTALETPWSDWRPKKGNLLLERYGLEGGPTKKGKPNKKHVPQQLADILDARRARTGGEGLIFKSNRSKSGAYHRNTGNKWLQELAALAGFGDHGLHAHSWRHGCACWLLSDEDWSLEAVKYYLAHADIKTTQRYAKMLGLNMQELVANTGLTLAYKIDDDGDTAPALVDQPCQG